MATSKKYLSRDFFILLVGTGAIGVLIFFLISVSQPPPMNASVGSGAAVQGNSNTVNVSISSGVPLELSSQLHMATSKKDFGWYARYILVPLFGSGGLVALIIFFSSKTAPIPAMNASVGNGAAVLGNSNTVNVSISSGDSKRNDEILEIVRRMERIEKEKSKDLKQFFPLGYIIFTATKREQIVPLGDSTWDKSLEIDWKSGQHSVQISENKITLHLPTLKLGDPKKGQMTFYPQDYSFPLPTATGVPLTGHGVNGLVLWFLIVSTNDPGPIMAIGLRRDDQFKPSTK